MNSKGVMLIKCTFWVCWDSECLETFDGFKCLGVNHQRRYPPFKKLVKGNKNSAFESSAPVKAAACSL